MKNLTKKQAYKLLEDKYGNYSFDDYVGGLCVCLPKDLSNYFRKYWRSKNGGNWYFMWDYFSHDASTQETSILRLLVACQFVEETYK